MFYFRLLFYSPDWQKICILTYNWHSLCMTSPHQVPIDCTCGWNMLIRTAGRVDMSQSKQNEAEHSILIVDDDAAFLDGARRALLANGIGNITTLQESGQVFRVLA